MRKQINKRKFGRPASQRKALMRTLSAELFLRGKIKTTEAKAKELRSVAEKYITKAKQGTLASRRNLLRFLPASAVKKLISEIAPGSKERHGGYTRIFKLGQRDRDGAKMAIIELVKSQAPSTK